MDLSMRATVPAHVASERVFDFDYIGDSLFLNDPHVGLAKLISEAPDIFFTPANGGHWVVLNYASCVEISRNPTDFF